VRSALRRATRSDIRIGDVKVSSSRRWLQLVWVALRVGVLVLGIATLVYGQLIRGVVYVLVAIALFAEAFVKRRSRRGKVSE
jgi:hypothetical protein